MPDDFGFGSGDGPPSYWETIPTLTSEDDYGENPPWTDDEAAPETVAPETPANVRDGIAHGTYDPASGGMVPTDPITGERLPGKPVAEAPEAAEAPTPRINAFMPVIAPGEIKAKLRGNWLVKGLVPKVGLGAIYGPSGGGKTFCALDLAMAIARGVPWRGRKTERAAVLYISPDGGEMVQNRIVAYCRKHEIANRDHSLYLAPCPIDLLARHSRPVDGTDAVLGTIANIEAVHGVKVGVVIVDTVSRSMPGGDENAAKDVTRLIENLSEIAGNDRAVIGIHHTPKSDATVLRGHSSLHGACDFELNIAGGVMTVAKQRDGESGIEFGFDLVVVELGFDEDGELVTSCVAVTADVTQKRPRLTDADDVGLRKITDLIAEHGEPLPQGTGFPTSGRYMAVTSALVTTSLRGSIFADKTASAARQCASRLRTRLQNLGLIGVNGGFVWLPSRADGRAAGDMRDAFLPDERDIGGEVECHAECHSSDVRDMRDSHPLSLSAADGQNPENPENPKQSASSGESDMSDMSVTVTLCHSGDPGGEA